MKPDPIRFLLPAVALLAAVLATFAPANDVLAARNDPKAKSGGGAVAESKPGDDKPFDSVVKDMEMFPGLFTFYRNAEDGKLLMEIGPGQLDRLFLFAGSVDHSTGERAFYSAQQLGDFACFFRRVGKTVRWMQKNTSFVAEPGTPQARTVARSFPDAILASAKLLSKPHPDRGSVLVDVQELFAARDLPGFAPVLGNVYSPSTFTYDKERSIPTGVRAFPENVLVELSLHYTTDNPRSTSITLADRRSVPITVKYDLSALPASTYRPRLADDRIGHFLVVHQDYSSDQPQSPYRRYVTRWHLEKQDSAAAVSPPKQPIVFWLENTIPLEYRDAVRDGALLWNRAFEKAGFRDAIVVKQQPDSADWDPADVRYSTIRWFAGVDATFAIGPSRSNPFTGQIYDADISISDGIVRGARRLGEELVSPLAAPEQRPGPAAWSKDPGHLCDYGDGMAQQAAFGMELLDARGTLTPDLEKKLMYEYVLELTCHEVGHTLGLRHNFRGSSILDASELHDTAKTTEIGQSSSVMDYNPVIVAGEGEAQGHFVPVTLGPYDYWAIEYAYAPFGGDEAAALAAIASRAADPMLPYCTDEDARGTYSPLSIDPLANQYDQSKDPLEYFQRRVALVNELWSKMETRLARPGDGWQIVRRALARGLADVNRSLLTSSKFVGGVYHVRDHVGDPNGRPPYTPVPAAKQREALQFLARNAFADSAFRLGPGVMGKLAIERNPGLDPAYFSVVRLDYPWHDAVLGLQRGVLARLLHPVTLARVQDNELRFPAGETPFRMLELFSALNASIWSELDSGAAEISSLRRNLQREHLNQLVQILLRRRPAGGAGPGGGPAMPAPPEDATTLARWALARIQAKAAARLVPGIALETTTRAHLQETRARIEAALAAQVQATID
jgi:hypothetical protein